MIDLTITSYFVAGVVAYYLLLFVLCVWHQTPAAGPEHLRFVIFVPALNEEQVIAQTLESLLALDHPRLVVCVADDASSDRTWEVLSGYRDDPRVVLIRRTLPHARVGKSDVLNCCYAETHKLLSGGHPILGGADPARVIVGIVDADGRLDRDCLRKVAPYFGDDKTAGVQIGVRIANATTNILTRFQDMEFVGFSAFVQRARDHLGSVGLGGNGQFTRLSALEDLHSTRGGPWQGKALTEDLELGLALVCRGWRTRFCPLAFVAQQGLPRWRALFRQRTRWTQGHYSCWHYIPRLLFGPRVGSARSRIDLAAYLLLVVTIIVVTFNAAVSVAANAGFVDVTTSFGDFLPDGVARRALYLGCAVAPLLCFMCLYQRHAVRPFHWWELPAATVLFALYAYPWILATAWALVRLAIGRRNWIKTPRVGDAAYAPRSESIAVES